MKHRSSFPPNFGQVGVNGGCRGIREGKMRADDMPPRGKGVDVNSYSGPDESVENASSGSPLTDLATSL